LLTIVKLITQFIR